MFELTVPKPPKTLSFLRAYLAAPSWNHAIHVVPMLAALDDREQLPFWPRRRAFEKGLLAHLEWALSDWSAFRAGGDHDGQKERLREHLPAFIGTIQDAAPAARLGDVPEGAIDQFADAVAVAIETAAAAIKENESFVLPSKVAHLLLPTLVPAYDREVIANDALTSLFPPRTRGARWFRTYVRLGWWLLRRLEAEGTLEAAREQVRDFLLGDWTINVMTPGRPRRESFVARSLDSFVAEYCVIGMSRVVPAGAVRIL